MLYFSYFLDYKDAFGAFNKDDKGVPVSEIGNMLRGLGYFPTQEEVSKIQESIGFYFYFYLFYYYFLN